MIRSLIVLIVLFLTACDPGQNTIQVMLCLDGNEIADLREYCLANSENYNSEYCRQVKFDLACDDYENNSLGVLIVENN